MYRIIGADGMEYGPVTTAQVHEWIREGRANAQTKVLPEGAADWQSLGSLPEFADALAAKPAPSVPPPMSATSAFTTPAEDQVSGPAIGLIVTAVLGFLWSGAQVVISPFSNRFHQFPAGIDPDLERVFEHLGGALGVAGGIFGLVLSVVVLVGALKMKKLTSYGWAMTACVLALFPCTSPCCFVGLPIGIWALVVLLKPEVKAAFQ